MKKLIIILLCSISFAASAQNYLNITNKDDKGNKTIYFTYQNGRYTTLQIMNNGTLISTYNISDVYSIGVTQTNSKYILEIVIQTGTDTQPNSKKSIEIPVDNIYYVSCDMPKAGQGQATITIVIH